ncbi:MAG: MBL fold metallo-hydrolase [Gemmiger sp.]|uniref:MBL fold metallo-hydrolase n=1 Tax=Gemmiger sp. TaxID=2049027 RepID=UPI002E7705BC|nr:MBL fold metallo-hydrolase [Gemmiger sp.]MEE0799856.1 MBL fold metallo-hydrolase [Gemmiger sp.]
MTQKIQDHLYLLDDGRVRQFLITGEDRALLLDTGFADSHLLPAVRAVTDAPLTVLLTHGDPDHAGGLADFEEAWLNEKDWPLVQAPVRLHPLREGDTFCCGGFRLETVEIPGHTYGSVAFADRSRRLLFAGDSVQKEGPIYLFGKHRSVSLYLESQRRLLTMAGEFDTVLPCHHDCPIDPVWIGRNLEDAEALQAGRLPSEPHPTLPCRVYQGRWTAFYCTEEDRLR